MNTTEVLKSVFVSFTLISLTGCLHLDVGFGRSHTHSRPTDRIIIVPAPGTDHGTIDEIDAVMNLSFDHEKEGALKRENLSPAAQVHLVDRTLKGISFANMRFAIMKTLVANPVFCAPAKENLLHQIDLLTFENYKSEILKAISKSAANAHHHASTERDAPLAK